jgi:hypothetical protein
VRTCCPPGHGCNAARGMEPCLLALCRAAAPEEPSAACAVARWSEWVEACARRATKRERRFHRRSYERARECALSALLMRAHAAAKSSEPKSAEPWAPTSACQDAARRGRAAGSDARGRRADGPVESRRAARSQPPASGRRLRRARQPSKAGRR